MKRTSIIISLIVSAVILFAVWRYLAHNSTPPPKPNKYPQPKVVTVLPVKLSPADSVAAILADPEYGVVVTYKFTKDSGMVRLLGQVWYHDRPIFSREVVPVSADKAAHVSEQLKRLCNREFLKDYYPTIKKLQDDGLRN
jgi:hypothetical protein